jgi:hypothetical protein
MVGVHKQTVNRAAAENTKGVVVRRQGRECMCTVCHCFTVKKSYNQRYGQYYDHKRTASCEKNLKEQAPTNAKHIWKGIKAEERSNCGQAGQLPKIQ